MKKGLFLLTLLSAIPAVDAQFNFGLYFGRPLTFFGYLNFASFYDIYSMYIDALIFLLIFLGLGKVVFGVSAEGTERERGYKLMYIGLALLMTISLLVLESRMGFSILELLGPWTSLILLGFLIVATVGMVSAFTSNKWAITGFSLISALVLFDSFSSYFSLLKFFSGFLRSLFEAGWHRLLYLAALLFLVIWVMKSFKKTGEAEVPGERPEAVPRPLSAGLPEEIREAEVRVVETVPEEIKQNLAALQEANVRLTRELGDLRRQHEQLMNELREAHGAADEEGEDRVKAEAQIVSEQAADVVDEKKKVEEEIKRLWELPKEIIEKRRPLTEEERKLLPARIVLGEAEKVIKKGVPPIEIGRIMKPKPPLLLPPPRDLMAELRAKRGKPEVLPSGEVIALPERLEREVYTEKEVEEALAAEGAKEEEKKILEEKTAQGELKKIYYLLKFLKSPRKLYGEGGRRDLIASLYGGRKPSSLDFLEDAQNYLQQLERGVDLCLKWFPHGKYASLFYNFKTAYSREKLTFVKVSSGYSEIKTRVSATLREIKKISPRIHSLILERVEKSYRLKIDLAPEVEQDPTMVPKEKDALLVKIAFLDNVVGDYAEVVEVHFGELEKVKDAVLILYKGLLKVRPGLYKTKVVKPE